jgi:hypothetical protein
MRGTSLPAPRPAALAEAEHGRKARLASSSLEQLIEMPLEELPVRPVTSVFRQVDGLTFHSVELVAVAEVGAQPGADAKPVAGINTQVSPVKKRVYV